MHGLRREQSRGLMMTVASVHPTPAINYNIGAESTDHADHILKDLVAPDPFGFLRRLRKAKVFSASKEKPHAVASGRRQQLLRADQSKLRRLFGAKIVLAALAARQGKQRHIGMQSASQIGEHRAALVVRMRGHVKDPRGDASLLDCLDGLRQAWAGTRHRRKLRVTPRTEQTYQSDYDAVHSSLH